MVTIVTGDLPFSESPPWGSRSARICKLTMSQETPAEASQIRDDLSSKEVGVKMEFSFCRAPVMVQVCPSLWKNCKCCILCFVIICSIWGEYLKRLVLPNHPFYHPFFGRFSTISIPFWGTTGTTICGTPRCFSYFWHPGWPWLTQPGTLWRAFLVAGAQSSSRLSRGGGSRHDDWMMEPHSEWSHHMWNICGISVEFYDVTVWHCDVFFSVEWWMRILVE